MNFHQWLNSIAVGYGSLKAVVSGLFSFCVPVDIHSVPSIKSIENSDSDSDVRDRLQKISKCVARKFDFSGEELRRAVEGFVQQMNDGLRMHGSTMEQLPSFVTRVPTGLEKGTYLAVDLGGTNIRVCSVILHGDGSHAIIQTKEAIPTHFMVSQSSKSLFSFVARTVEAFLKKNYPGSVGVEAKTVVGEVYARNFNLGFTFSHAIRQLDINRGTLIRWSKGFDIPGVVGRDVCALLQIELDELRLPVRVTALINDTVGTLMARAYASPSSAHTIMGAVFGTGSNGAYVEKISRISKLSNSTENDTQRTESDALMIVNTEWGNFDQKLEFLPNTSYDMVINSRSVNPGFEMFEKRISGMYLGEILRLVIVDLVNDPQIPLFSISNIPKTSQIYTQWAIDSDFMSILESDTSAQCMESRLGIEQRMGIFNATHEDAQALKIIAHAIGRRSARLSAIALGAVILQTESLESWKQVKGSKVDIGVDGSLIEMYPGFVEEIRGALREIPEIGTEGEKRIDITIAKDGSSIGAALTASVAAAALG